MYYFRNISSRFTIPGVIVAVSCLLVFGLWKSDFAHAEAVPVNSQDDVRTYMPKQIPLAISRVTTDRTGGKELELAFVVTNNSKKDFAKTNFVVLVVGPLGNVKSGVGQELRTNLTKRSSSSLKIAVNRVIGPNDSLILTAYKATGAKGTFEVNPIKVLDLLGQEGFVTRNVLFSKTVGTGLLQVSPCAAGQGFATSSCSCGVKTFSCNPETGEYSFECFPPPPGQSQCESGGAA